MKEIPSTERLEKHVIHILEYFIKNDIAREEAICSLGITIETLIQQSNPEKKLALTLQFVEVFLSRMTENMKENNI